MSPLPASRACDPATCGRKCAEREQAERDGVLMYSHIYAGWVLTDIPARSVSWQTRYYAEERGVDLHDGEPIIWVSCPWCGGDLGDAS